MPTQLTLKIVFFVAAFTVLISVCRSQEPYYFNGSFEDLNTRGLPKGWLLAITPDQDVSYKVSLDSLEKIGEKYSLCISKKAEGSQFAGAIFSIPQTFSGKQLELRGYVKTENITGFAGLWLRVDGKQSVLVMENMAKNGPKGSTDWKAYSINVPYDEAKAVTILAGGLIAGGGTLWLDKLELFMDGKPIKESTVKASKMFLAQTDTAFSRRSGIDTVLFSKQQVENLVVLGEVWGFLKYHHPAVAKGDYNFDNELFRIMPAVLQAKDNTALSNILERWTDKFGVPPQCKDCEPHPGRAVFTKPDYGNIFTPGILSTSFTGKLKFILANRNKEEHYYISMAPEVGNPIFSNELSYANMSYPDPGYRLLCLYRYWNMIQYFFPYRHLIGSNWANVLKTYIPRFIQAKNKTEYVIATLELVGSIHDTHGNLPHIMLEEFKGMKAFPFQTKFIENKLTATGFYNDTLNVKEKVRPGDIITTIDGVGVQRLVEKWLPLTPGSNHSVQLRELAANYLSRSHKNAVRITIKRNGITSDVTINTIDRTKLNNTIDYMANPGEAPYKLLEDNIGYLFSGMYKNIDLPEIKKLFTGTRGIIVDMRCYPSDFMIYTFVPYIKSGAESFVKFSLGSVQDPGQFTLNQPLNIQGTGEYQGKVVVIVNERTQSQAEYTTMALQSSPNVTVIGSTTAGADGNVSAISLPGGLRTMISGIGVLYPDGTETQRKGVRIDEIVKPTTKGIAAAKDELLERARQIILQHK